MTFRSKILSAAGAVLFGLAISAPADAALIDGGPVDGGVFFAAGLGDGTGWNHLALPQIFGAGPGSNGMFVDGGTATFVPRSASYGQKFGVADYSDHNPSSVIFDTTTRATTIRWRLTRSRTPTRRAPSSTTSSSSRPSAARRRRA